MTTQIRLYSQDWSTLLLETTSDAEAGQFLRDSGLSWLSVVLEPSQSWKQRYAGRIQLHSNGTWSIASEAEFLKHIVQWPNVTT